MTTMRTTTMTMIWWRWWGGGRGKENEGQEEEKEEGGGWKAKRKITEWVHTLRRVPYSPFRIRSLSKPSEMFHSCMRLKTKLHQFSLGERFSHRHILCKRSRFTSTDLLCLRHKCFLCFSEEEENKHEQSLSSANLPRRDVFMETTVDGLFV